MRRLALSCLLVVCGACNDVNPSSRDPQATTGPAPTTASDIPAGAPSAAAAAAEARPPLALGSIAEQDATRTAWLRERLDEVLPGLMRAHGVDAWLVLAREYNEGPEFFSLVAPQTLAARRTTILAFFDRGPEQGVERLALGGEDRTAEEGRGGDGRGRRRRQGGEARGGVQAQARARHPVSP